MDVTSFPLPGRRRRATPPSAGWHPHFGDIKGLTLARWLARQPPAPPPTRSLVIASDERTGSEWLCQMLGDTGRLGRPSEYINTTWMRRFIPDYPTTVAEQIAIAHRVGTTGNGCFAMKLHAWHFDRLAAEISLRDAFPGVVFVRLTRRDMLAQAISLFRARQTDRFHAHVDGMRAPEFDAGGIADRLAELALGRARWDMYFARNGIVPLALDYETLHRRPRWCVRRIGLLLGVTLPRFSIGTGLGLRVQRDAVSEQWRARFLAEKRDLDRFDPPPT